MDWSHWPIFGKMWGVGEWVNLDLSEFAKLECINPTNFYDRLFGTVFTATLMLLAPITSR